MKNNDPRQRGSAILYIFVFVALFAFLAYIFSYGTRGNLGWFQDEQSRAATTAAQQCSNNMTMATKRLEARGCGTLISTATDGSNSNPGAPTDGSCSIYHPNGGGIRPCDGVITPTCDLTSLAVGQSTCGVIYAGTVTGRRIYAYATDIPGTITWDNGNGYNENFAGAAGNANDGKPNTDFLIGHTTGSSYPYAAAEACRALGAEFYLPATNELMLIYNERNTGDFAGTVVTGGSFLNSVYWTSREQTTANAYYIRMAAGTVSYANRDQTRRVRCVRTD